MIISASRRTDIPAFYSAWLLKRLQAGYVYVRNPVNFRQISKIALAPDLVDCIVFWTKNAAPMLNKLDMIKAMGYSYYFLWTVNPYGQEVERNLPDKARVINSFKALSDKIGSHRVVWRYDPVIVSRRFPLEYHVQEFAKLCQVLAGYTDKCIFSFVDIYAKLKQQVNQLLEAESDSRMMQSVAAAFAAVARQHKITLETCAEQIDLSQWGIGHAACIDKHMIERLLGVGLAAKSSKSQREACRCLESVDIGAYDCCPHGCGYCYANISFKNALANQQKHETDSPLLIGRPCAVDKISERKLTLWRSAQQTLF